MLPTEVRTSLSVVDLDHRLELLGRRDPDALAEVGRAFASTPRKLIAVDDDPTGTQTVAGADVITTWDQDDIDWLVNRPSPIGFVLTNGRALTPDEVEAANTEVGRRLADAERRLGVDLVVVSRSDSTLRGHFPLEVDALRRGLGGPPSATMLVPFFAEGGRLTIDGVHYVREGTRLVPVGRTNFARDLSFGFRHSDLCCWIEEKTGGRIPAHSVDLLDIDTIRAGGIEAAVEVLRRVPADGFCVVDAVDHQDLAVAVAAVLRSEASGQRWLFRSAAGLIPTLVGRSPSDPVVPPPIGSTRGGLVVAGSHVPVSTRQIASLSRRPGVQVFEASAAELADPARAPGEVDRMVASAAPALARGAIVLMATSRALVSAEDLEGSLRLTQRIAAGMARFVAELPDPPAWLVAKGGITSHAVTTQGLGARRSEVLGPIIPGVPMLAVGPDARFPGLPYAAFAGNVGDDWALAEVVDRFEAGRR